MKKVLFIMMLGMMFGQTKLDYIKYSKNNSKDIIEHKNIEAKGQGEYKIKLIIRKKSSTNFEYVHCKDVIEIVYNNNSIDCDNLKKILTEKNTENTTDIVDMNKYSIGGFFIGMGGAILLRTNNRECISECSESNENHLKNTENFLDDIKFMSNVGYGLIMIGGFLILIGI